MSGSLHNDLSCGVSHHLILTRVYQYEHVASTCISRSLRNYHTSFFSEPERKTLIEKLAVFVARNGHDFEKLTRNKQRHNPKFSFLFGGNHCDYYRYRLAAEKTGEEKLFYLR